MGVCTSQAIDMRQLISRLIPDPLPNYSSLTTLLGGEGGYKHAPKQINTIITCLTFSLIGGGSSNSSGTFGTDFSVEVGEH